MPSYIAFIDGGSRGNPGPAAAGVLLLDSETRKPFFEAGFFLGHNLTNNVAEYSGLIKALEIALAKNATALHVTSDSQLMVRQINGEYKVKHPDLKKLHAQAKQLFAKLDTWSMTHVLRDKNVRADELANLALDAQATISSDDDDIPFPDPPPLPRASENNITCPNCGHHFPPA